MLENKVPIPLNDPSRAVARDRADIMRAFSRVLDSGHFILGPENELLSQELSEFLGGVGTVLVGNGTDALEIALRSVGVPSKSFVLTVANAGGYATAAIRQVGAIPIYVDIDEANLQMDAEALEETLSALSEKPSAVIVTHLFGFAAPFLPIVRRLKELAIPLIEDCAQSFGAKIGAKHVGTFGQIGTTSFYPTKNLAGIGDGGAVFTSEPEYLERATALRQYGWKKKYHSEFPDGRNSRLDELQAAVLRQRLPFLGSQNQIRRSIHSHYRGLESSIGYFPHEAGENFVPHLAVMVANNRLDAISTLKRHNIATDIHYPVLDYLQKTNELPQYPHLPVSEDMSRKILTVPLFPAMYNYEVEAVSNSLQD